MIGAFAARFRFTKLELVASGEECLAVGDGARPSDKRARLAVVRATHFALRLLAKRREDVVKPR